MKKLTISLTFIVFAISYEAFAQRHMEGVSHLELHAGYVNQVGGQHYHGGFYYSYIRNRKWWWRIGADANYQRMQVAEYRVPVEKYYGKFNYFRTLGSMFNHGLYFNVGLGPVLGYEQYNKGKTRLNEAVYFNNDNNRFALGASAVANMELFLSNKTILNFEYEKRAVFNSQLSRWNDILSVGFKFYLE